MISPFIIGPAVGGVIGCFTNYLAIKMLFRPYTEKHIFGIKVPFTPGIIPKEKHRIAQSLGKAISENLMNKEVLEKNLLADDMTGKIRAALTDFAEKQKHNPETLKQFLEHYLSDQEIQTATVSIKQGISQQIGDKLKDTALGEKVATIVIDHVTASIRDNGLPLNIPEMLKAIIGKGLWKSVAELIQAPAHKFLAKNINSLLQNNGEQIVGNLMATETDRLMSTPVCRLLQGHDKDIEQLIDSLMGMYRRLITEQLPKILETIDIPKIIEGRINEMDMAQTEKLIFDVMNKELNAIIWLGAALGFLLGFVTALV